MDPQTLLARQAAYVRELYCIARRRHEAKQGKVSEFGEDEIPRWDGGMDSNGREYQPVWPKVVAFCMKHGLDPATLVKAIFDNNQSPHPPVPTSLYGTTALSLYSTQALSERLLIKHELSTYTNQANKYFVSFSVREKAEPALAWRLVVEENPPLLSPLFRYCLAVKAGFDDLADKYRDAAMHEYFWAKDAYDEVWSEWIPEELRMLAERSQQALAAAFSEPERN
jgi:hypothetical protein